MMQAQGKKINPFVLISEDIDNAIAERQLSGLGREHADVLMAVYGGQATAFDGLLTVNYYGLTPTAPQAEAINAALALIVVSEHKEALDASARRRAEIKTANAAAAEKAAAEKAADEKAAAEKSAAGQLQNAAQTALCKWAETRTLQSGDVEYRINGTLMGVARKIYQATGDEDAGYYRWTTAQFELTPEGDQWFSKNKKRTEQ